MENTTNKTQDYVLTTDERVEAAKKFISFNNITDEDLKQELYLTALETDPEAFTFKTKERNMKVLDIIFEDVVEKHEEGVTVVHNSEIPVGCFLKDMDQLIFSILFGGKPL